MTININLLPWREALKEQQKKEFISMQGLAALSAIATMLIVHLLFNYQITFQGQINEYLKNEIKILDNKIAEIKALKKEKQRLLARMEIIQQLQTNRPQIVRLFNEIVKTVPEGLYLTSLTRTGNSILMDGKAESNTRVSTFMRNIESSKWLKNPILTVIQADNSKQTDSFSDRLIDFKLQAEEVENGNSALDKNTTPSSQSS